MKQIAFLILLLILNALNTAQAQENDTTKTDNPIETHQIPANLDQCFEILNTQFSPEKLELFRNFEENKIIRYHSTLGRSIRKYWLAEKNTRLIRYFYRKRIIAEDDISAIIILSWHRYLNGKEIKLKEQVKEKRKYWRKQGFWPLSNKIKEEDSLWDEKELKGKL